MDDEDETIASSDEEEVYDGPDDNSAGSTSGDFQELDEAMEEFLFDRLKLAKEISETHRTDHDNNLGKKHTIVLQVGLDNDIDIKRVPDDFVAPQPKPGEVKFEDLDNPGEWPEYCFRAKFNKKRNISTIAYLQGQLLFQRAKMVQERLMVGSFLQRSRLPALYL